MCAMLHGEPVREEEMAWGPFLEMETCGACSCSMLRGECVVEGSLLQASNLCLTLGCRG